MKETLFSTLAITTALAAILLLIQPHPISAQQAERHVLRGSDVAIYNLVGELRVEAGTGSDVVVEVTRGGADARTLRVETGRIDRRETLRVFPTSDRVVYSRMGRGSRSQIRVQNDGTFGRGGGRQVTVAGSGSGQDAYADLRVMVPSGQRIAVHQGVGTVWVSNVAGEIRVDAQSASAEVDGVRGPLTVNVGSGSVRVRNASGNVSVDTGSGNVEVTAIRGQRLHVDTGSGAVSGSDVEVASLEVDTGSGSVRLTGVRTGEAVIDTGSGSVNLGFVAPVRSLKVDTGSGGVTLTVPSTQGAELNIGTGSGGISVDLPLRDVQSTRSRLTAKVGNAEGRIHVRTGSGGVRIRTGA